MQKNEAARAMGKLSAEKRKEKGFDYKEFSKKGVEARRLRKVVDKPERIV